MLGGVGGVVWWGGVLGGCVGWGEGRGGEGGGGGGSDACVLCRYERTVHATK